MLNQQRVITGIVFDGIVVAVRR